MNAIITVENLSKRYMLKHQRKERYVVLRDVLSNKIKSLFAKPGAERSEFSEEEFWALKNVNIEINRGDRVGIIGRNGAGKSTLLKILSRITEPTTGRIVINGRIASLLEVGTGFHPELTGRENIFLNGSILGMNKAEIKSKFDEIVAFAEVEKFLDTPVKRYSSGMYVRLAFAVAAHLDPEILVVDEVLAVGDAQFQKKCLGKMEDVSRDEGRTVIFVSHTMSTIQKLCNKAFLLNQGEIAASGDTQAVIACYEKQLFHSLSRSSKSGYQFYYSNYKQDDFAIHSVRFTDLQGNFISNIKTFDDMAIEVEWYSPYEIQNGSINLFLKTLGGNKILRFGTRPDHSFPLPFAKGINRIICRVNKLPLPAGQYLFSAGLAIPMRDWLMQDTELFTMEVLENDIFMSGYAPLLDNSFAVAQYSWSHG